MHTNFLHPLNGRSLFQEKSHDYLIIEFTRRVLIG